MYLLWLEGGGRAGPITPVTSRDEHVRLFFIFRYLTVARDFRGHSEREKTYSCKSDDWCRTDDHVVEFTVLGIRALAIAPKTFAMRGDLIDRTDINLCPQRLVWNQKTMLKN